MEIEKGDASPPKSSRDTAEKKTNRSGNIHSSKFNFRAPQQFVKKKMWNKRHNKADVENLQNIKNQVRNTKQTYNKKMVSHRNISETSSGVSTFSVRSKFFLPDKRPRKEIIIPPTKFLLGGNISDPLNLNSLQDEAIFGNTTPSSTPRQSPITTPPKVEIYLPPNINDPLHLLDPVDSLEYEKQLVSPMKRKTKHRHRKKKPKRRRLDSLSSLSKLKVDFGNILQREIEKTKADTVLLPSTNKIDKINEKDVNTCSHEKVEEIIPIVLHDENAYQSNNNLSADDTNEQSSEEHEPKLDVPLRRSDNRDKVAKELKLELTKTDDPLQISNNCGCRKRKISEGQGSTKNKFRRLDSMDKIVSPVVPQPGAWKRPPRTVPTGARKSSRNRSTSISESELISPSEEIKVEDNKIETIRLNVVENTKVLENYSLPTVTRVEPSVKTVTTTENSEPKPSVENALFLPREPKFKPEGLKYQYGNFDHYSSYRNFNESVDVRLQVFLRNSDLFKNKDILDIGCNVGHMTIAVGRSLAPKSILGIDIDPKLIGRARRNLSLFVKIPKNNDNIKLTTKNEQSTELNKDLTKPQIDKLAHDTSNNNIQVTNKNKRNRRRKRNMFQKLNNRQGYADLFPISFPICYGGIPCFDTINNTSPSVGSDGGTGGGLGGAVEVELLNEFPKNVFFRQTNYVLKDESLLNNDVQQYDIIMCLSVTKWIHLNFGDAGLKLAFKRMFNQLRPGGKLILEAQNWASYKKKKNLTETIYKNYSCIEFFPNKFHEYLLSNEVGFSHSFTLGVPRHFSKGFTRPIQLYAKGDFTPNHVQWSDAYNPQTPYVAYRGIYASIPRPPYPQCWETPRSGGNTSCFQTPMYQPGSQYYNPLETDSYLPSYDTEILNRHYVFASPLYQTVWSPPANLKNSSSHTPVFGSVREAEIEGQDVPRHVYPPTAESPLQVNSAFSVREESELDESPKRQHVYANCDSSSSPKTDGDG